MVDISWDEKMLFEWILDYRSKRIVWRVFNSNLRLKNITMQFLLSVNEDFDDDLLGDVINLLSIE